MIRRKAVGIDAVVRQHVATVGHSRLPRTQKGNATLADDAAMWLLTKRAREVGAAKARRHCLLRR